MIYLLCFILFGVGIYGILVQKNIIKLIMSTMIASYAIHMFFIASGFRWHAAAPVLSLQKLNQETIMVDPLPQALVLTAIVISLGSLALMVSICIRTYEKYGTFDITKIRRLKG